MLLVHYMLVAQSCPILCNPRTIALQASLSMNLSRQEYWSGLPFPTPGDLPDLKIKPPSLDRLCLLHWQADSLSLCNLGSHWVGQKVHSAFSIRWDRKTWTNFLPNPIYWAYHHLNICATKDNHQFKLSYVTLTNDPNILVAYKNKD